MGKLSNQARLMPPRSQGWAPFDLGRSCMLAAAGWIGWGMVAMATPSLSGESGRGVSSRLESSPQILGSPVLLAQRSRQIPVKFDPGKSSATIKNSVLRGTRDIYLLGASRQQVMTITLTSLENNAVFDLMAPPNSTANRRVMREGVRELTVRLPQSGEYQIVVGPTRGNASYRLVVSVK
jgi:hypothetical protein